MWQTPTKGLGAYTKRSTGESQRDMGLRSTLNPKEELWGSGV